jgi:hypothetical protein
VPKASSPLVGFNNNVKHHGRVFHVQTEDSGVKRPHIVTHLFADGGRIIKSTRTDYSEHLGRADLQPTIRRLMKEQHKAMFIALRDGQLNETIEKVLGAGGASEGAADEGVEAKAPRTPPGAHRSNPSPTLPDVPAAESMSLPPELDDAEPASSPVTQRRAAPTLTDLVLADLESARSRGGAATVSASAGRPAVRGGTPVLGTPTAQQRPAVPAAAGRYAPARPANIFSTPPEPTSIFGGSSISEQSLDEVILSYLAEDLDGIGDE